MLAYNLFGAQTAGYKITGSGAVTKTGGGTLTLASLSNSYSGGTNVLQGLMIVAPASHALPKGTLFVSGSLDLEDNSPTATTLNGNGTIGNGDVLAKTSSLTVTSGGTWAGTIQNGGFGGSDQVALVVSGGTLTLSGTNSYTGGTYVEGTGTLIVGDGNPGSDLSIDEGEIGTNLFVGMRKRTGAVRRRDIGRHSGAGDRPKRGRRSRTGHAVAGCVDPFWRRRFIAVFAGGGKTSIAEGV